MPRRRYSRGYAKTRRRYGGRGSALTGGTGDVNPQWMNMQTLSDPASGTAITAYLSAESVVPLQQQALMASKGSKSMVMELLKVEFGKTAGVGVGRVALTTRSLSATPQGGNGTGDQCDINQPHVIAGMNFDGGADGFRPNIGSTQGQYNAAERRHVELIDARYLLRHCR